MLLYADETETGRSIGILGCAQSSESLFWRSRLSFDLRVKVCCSTPQPKLEVERMRFTFESRQRLVESALAWLGPKTVEFIAGGGVNGFHNASYLTLSIRRK